DIGHVIAGANSGVAHRGEDRDHARRKKNYSLQNRAHECWRGELSARVLEGRVHWDAPHLQLLSPTLKRFIIGSAVPDKHAGRRWEDYSCCPGHSTGSIVMPL